MGDSEDTDERYWRRDGAERPPLIVRDGLYRVVHAVLHPTISWVWKIDYVDCDLIPSTGPVILAGTHRSNLDSLFLPAVTRRPVNFMAKKEFFKYPAGDKLMRRLGAFPVNRGTADKYATTRALEVLRAGGVLGIYPEGTRRSGDEIWELTRGTSWLAYQAQAPIVPVGLGGTEAVQPKGYSGAHLGKVRMVCGEPLAPPLSRNKRDLDAHTEALHKALQDVFDRAGGPGGI